MKEHLKCRLKNNFALRAIIKPYIDVKRYIDLINYQKSADSEYMKSLKNTHINERCFIIGNGPSLKAEDLDKLCGEFCFASNRIFNIFDRTKWRPTVYLAVDNSFIDESGKELNKYELDNLFLGVGKKFDISKIKGRVTRIFEYTKFKINKWSDCSAFISEDVSRFFSVGYTVTFTAIQLALYMGFKEIYLLGVDFSYSVVRDKYGKIHVDNSIKDYFWGEKYSSTVLSYDANLNAYKKARDYAETHKIKIYNATRGGHLEVFERIDFDNIDYDI